MNHAAGTQPAVPPLNLQKETPATSTEANTQDITTSRREVLVREALFADRVLE
jgi:hypothetical protein